MFSNKWFLGVPGTRRVHFRETPEAPSDTRQMIQWVEAS